MGRRKKIKTVEPAGDVFFWCPKTGHCICLKACEARIKNSEIVKKAKEIAKEAGEELKKEWPFIYCSKTMSKRCPFRKKALEEEKA